MKKKKVVSMILALVMAMSMIFTLVACGGGDSGNSESPAPSASESQPAEPSASEPAAPAESVNQDDWIDLDLTFATYLTETNPCQENITVFQEKLDQYMPGKVKITTYANNTLLKGADIYDGVLNGTCDIGLVQQDYTPSRFPISQIFMYPGIIYNCSEVATRVFQDWGKTTDAAEMDGFVLLMGIGSAGYCIFTNFPITSLADLAGKQIRAGGVNAELIAAYGATPVTMDISEVYDAMRSSLIDGLYTNYGACAYQNMEEVGKYAMLTPLSMNPSMYIMNQERFDSMPPAQQEAFMKAADETFEEVTTKYQDEGFFEDRVVEFASKTDRYYLEGDMLAEFQEAGASLMDELVADLDAQGLDGTGEYNKIVALADKYNEVMTWDDYKTCFPDDMDTSNN